MHFTCGGCGYTLKIWVSVNKKGRRRSFFLSWLFQAKTIHTTGVCQPNNVIRISTGIANIQPLCNEHLNPHTLEFMSFFRRDALVRDERVNAANGCDECKAAPSELARICYNNHLL